MPEESSYKPFLPSDKEYLNKVAGLIAEKEPLEEIPFDNLNRVLEAVGILENPYDRISVSDMKGDRVQDLADQSFQNLQAVQLTPELKERLDRLWDYLAEADEPRRSDIIFVFGGPLPYRFRTAIGLYNQGLGKKLLFSGNKSSYMEEAAMTEADYGASLALAAGIPQDDLILEQEARNTPENAIKSIELFRKEKEIPASLILVTRDYHMRRAYLTFKAAAYWNPVLFRVTAPSEEFGKENYFHSQKGWTYVFFEYIKLYGARLMKHF